MKTILALALIALLAVFGSRLFERTLSIPAWFRRFFADGMLYLFVGIAMGPSLLNLINDNLVDKLSPVITIGLFWVGLLIGINLKYRDIKRFTLPVYVLALGQSIFTFALVAVVFAVVLRDMTEAIGTFPLAAAIVTLAACACGTGQTALLRLSMNRDFRGPTAQYATVTATLDDVPAVFATGILTFFWHQTGEGQPALSGIAWIGIASLMGIFGGVVAKLLLDRAENDQARLLIVLAGASVGGGLSAYLHLSPIFIGAVMGVTYINLSDRDDRVFQIVTRSESTIYILFLLVVGSLFHFGLTYLAFLTVSYLVLRTLGKALGGAFFNIGHTRRARPSRLVGLALLPQGGLALAIAIHYRSLYHSPIADTVVTVVILSALINQIYAVPLALRVAKRRPA